ncbi:MAG: hypothetical protein HC822_16580 [Oscillochloris sp.]|nr:hypothetical protein [Oscillochloris sp.]
MEQPLVPTEPKGPPLPKWSYAIMNPLMMAALRSPLHGALSDNLMILIFDGRKSGQRYTIPVGYLEEAGKLYLFSHAAWGANFIGGAPVGMRLRGKLRRGIARVIESDATISRILRLMVEKRGEGMAEQMGFISRNPDGSMQLGRPRNTRFIEITLDPD